MKSLAACLGALTMMAAAAAPAATNYTGNEMLDDLRSLAPARELNAHRYIQGVVDMHVIERGAEKDRPYSRKYACLPAEITAGQVLDLVRLELERNPAARHHGAAFFVLGALLKAYPCPDNPRPEN